MTREIEFPQCTGMKWYGILNITNKETWLSHMHWASEIMKQTSAALIFNSIVWLSVRIASRSINLPYSNRIQQQPFWAKCTPESIWTLLSGSKMVARVRWVKRHLIMVWWMTLYWRWNSALTWYLVADWLLTWDRVLGTCFGDRVPGSQRLAADVTVISGFSVMKIINFLTEPVQVNFKFVHIYCLP